MKDQSKTKQALIQELASLKLRIAELEQAESERMRVEKIIQLSEADYIEIFGDIPDAVYSADAEGKIIFISPAIEQIMGYQPGELEGKSFYQFIHPDDLSMIRGRVGDLSKNVLKPEEYRIITSAGTARWVMSFSRPLFQDGIFQGIRGVITDIHDRKLAEEALRESEELYRTLIETSPDAVLMYALDGTILMVNGELIRKYGAASAEEFHAEVKTVFDLLDGPDQAFAAANFKHTLTTGESRRNEYRINLRDGSYLSVEINSSVVRTADGKPRAFISVVRDISERKQIKEALRISEEMYRNLFEHANESIAITQEGRIVFPNPQLTLMTGYSAEELISRPFTDFIHPDDRELVRDRHIRRLQGEDLPKTYDYQLIHREGHIIWVNLNVIVIEWRGKGATLCFLSDITERKQMEETLRKSEEQHRTLFENVSEAIFVAQDGFIVFLNPNTSAMTGYPAEELTAKLFTAFIHPDDREMVIDRHVRRMKGEELPHRYAFRIIHSDGGIRWVELNTVLINWNGRAATLNFLSDITARMQADATLGKSEAEKRIILESVSDMIFYIDTDMRVIYSNVAMERFFNLPDGDLTGLVCHQALHHRDRPCRVCPAGAAMETGGIHESFVSSYGRHWRLRGYPVMDEGGTITGAIEVVSDITDLRNAEEKYKSIFDNAMEGIYQSTPDGRLVSVNPALARIFGYDSPETMMNEVTSVGRSLYVDSDRRQIFLELVDEQGIAKNFEFEGSKKNGDRIYVSDNARAVKDSKNKTLYYEGIIQDITERKRAEDALRESEERFRALSENAPDIIYTMNLEGAVTYANPSWKRILGHDEEEVLGRYFTDFVREEDRRAHRKQFKSIRDDGNTVSNYIGVMLTKDGKERVLNMNSAFMRDARGSVVSVVGTMKDITEQREMEKKLQQAQKLEAIGTLAGGIAHDFNNLLMGIQGYASLTLLDLDPSHPHYERLKRIEEQVQSGADLTKQLLGFARGGRYETRPADMNDIASKTASMFIRTKKEITLYRNLAQNLRTVDCDQGQMEQVLMNLYVNAWQAMPGGGDLSLETANVLLGEDHALLHTLKPGRYVKISISDTGMGMDEKTQERIFDPFFTTKGMGRGTGLGLAMVYGIIKGHGGAIDVTSEPGRGTTFDIYLPASEKAIVREQVAEKEILTGTETILLVDDEPFVLEVTRDLLESLGYRVHAVGSGQEAIAVYLEKRNGIDLVILDMIMPGISGGETFDRLREIDPDIRVLLSSGYSIEGRARQILERGCNGFLQKPFQLAMLSRKVREVLNGADNCPGSTAS